MLHHVPSAFQKAYAVGAISDAYEQSWVWAQWYKLNLACTLVRSSLCHIMQSEVVPYICSDDTTDLLQ